MSTFEALEGWQRVDGLAGLPFGEADLIKALQIQPEFRGRAKEMGKPQGRVAGDGAPSIQDFGNAIGGNIQLPRQFGGAHAQLLQLFRQMFTWVNWNYCHVTSPNRNRQYTLVWGRASASSLFFTRSYLMKTGGGQTEYLRG